MPLLVGVLHSREGRLLVTSWFLFAGGSYEKAIECAKTYLLFFPNDEVMNQNLAYYTAVLGEKLAAPISPREVSDPQPVPGKLLREFCPLLFSSCDSQAIEAAPAELGLLFAGQTGCSLLSRGLQC